MTSYSFRAIGPNGKTITGKLEAESDLGLIDRLSQQGYVVLNVTKVGSKKRRKMLRAKLQDLVLFTRQLSTMINAGIRIKDALLLLSRQAAFTPSFRKSLSQIVVSIDGGMSFSEAIDDIGVFDPIFVNLVRAGESGGVLDEAMLKVSKFYEDSKKVQDEVRSAMAYPLFVSIFAILIMMVIGFFILPNLLRAFGNVKPTGVVAILINVNDFISQQWPAVLASVLFVIFGGIVFLRTPYGMATRDFILNLFPPIKKLRHFQHAADFSKTLSTLISSGVSITEAVDMAAHATSSQKLIKLVPSMVETLKNGGTLKEAMEKVKFFPQLLVEMVGSGEESGRVDDMLTKVAEFYDQEVSVRLKQIVSMIEPAMIAIIGLFVGFMVFNLYQTMFNLEQGVGQQGLGH